MKNTSNKKIVTIGGGSGQSLLLEHLKNYDFDITAIVSMVDSGGSTGELRKELGVLPPGDVRKCLIALATQHPELQEAAATRFNDGHNFGNFILSGLELKLGSFDKAVRHMEKVWGVEGRVEPSTLDNAQLVARLKNGSLVSGEANIDVSKGGRAKIQRVFLAPKAKAYKGAVEAIKKADFIIYTIGDLYTSLIPNLLCQGIPEAIKRSKAIKIFTINRTNKKGETDDFEASDYIKTLLFYLKPDSLDVVLVDKNRDKPGRGYQLVENNIHQIERMGIEVEEAVLSLKKDLNHIDGKKLAKALNILCQKFS